MPIQLLKPMDEAWTKHIGNSFWTGSTTHWIDSVKIYREKDTFQPRKAKCSMVFPWFLSMIFLLVTPKIAGFSCWEQTNNDSPRLLGGDELHEDFARGATHVVLLHMHTAGPPKIPGTSAKSAGSAGEMSRNTGVLESGKSWQLKAL